MILGIERSDRITKRGFRSKSKIISVNCDNRDIVFNKTFLKTYLQKENHYCSQKCGASSKNTMKKRKDTCMKVFGSSSPMGSDEVKKKMKETLIKKHEVENPFQSKEVKENQSFDNFVRTYNELR